MREGDGQGGGGKGGVGRRAGGDVKFNCSSLTRLRHPTTHLHTAATGVDRLSGLYERRWIDSEAAWAASFTRNVPRRLYRPRAQLRCEVLGLEVEMVDASRPGTSGNNSKRY